MATSTTCSPKTIVYGEVASESGFRIRPSSPHIVAAMLTRTTPGILSSRDMAMRVTEPAYAPAPMVRGPALLSLVALALAAGCGGAVQRPRSQAAGIQKIRHVIIVMQENRSFDHYFGPYPGADGIPRGNGQFTVCVPDPIRHVCWRPYHDPAQRNSGGPHEHLDAIRDVNGGKMNGFIRQARRGLRGGCKKHPGEPLCTRRHGPDVMGYKDARDIPNYWAYARNFVLQDHMFQPDASWSLPDHLFM